MLAATAALTLTLIPDTSTHDDTSAREGSLLPATSGELHTSFIHSTNASSATIPRKENWNGDDAKASTGCAKNEPPSANAGAQQRPQPRLILFVSDAHRLTFVRVTASTLGESLAPQSATGPATANTDAGGVEVTHPFLSAHEGASHTFELRPDSNCECTLDPPAPAAAEVNREGSAGFSSLPNAVIASALPAVLKRVSFTEVVKPLPFAQIHLKRTRLSYCSGDVSEDERGTNRSALASAPPSLPEAEPSGAVAADVLPRTYDPPSPALDGGQETDTAGNGLRFLFDDEEDAGGGATEEAGAVITTKKEEPEDAEKKRGVHEVAESRKAGVMTETETVGPAQVPAAPASLRLKLSGPRATAQPTVAASLPPTLDGVQATVMGCCAPEGITAYLVDLTPIGTAATATVAATMVTSCAVGFEPNPLLYAQQVRSLVVAPPPMPSFMDNNRQEANTPRYVLLTGCGDSSCRGESDSKGLDKSLPAFLSLPNLTLCPLVALEAPRDTEMTNELTAVIGDGDSMNQQSSSVLLDPSQLLEPHIESIDVAACGSVARTRPRLHRQCTLPCTPSHLCVGLDMVVITDEQWAPEDPVLEAVGAAATSTAVGVGRDEENVHMSGNGGGSLRVGDTAVTALQVPQTSSLSSTFPSSLSCSFLLCPSPRAPADVNYCFVDVDPASCLLALDESLLDSLRVVGGYTRRFLCCDNRIPAHDEWEKMRRRKESAWSSPRPLRVLVTRYTSARLRGARGVLQLEPNHLVLSLAVVHSLIAGANGVEGYYLERGRDGYCERVPVRHELDAVQAEKAVRGRVALLAALFRSITGACNIHDRSGLSTATTATCATAAVARGHALQIVRNAVLFPEHRESVHMGCSSLRYGDCGPVISPLALARFLRAEVDVLRFLQSKRDRMASHEAYATETMGSLLSLSARSSGFFRVRAVALHDMLMSFGASPTVALTGTPNVTAPLASGKSPWEEFSHVFFGKACACRRGRVTPTVESTADSPGGFLVTLKWTTEALNIEELQDGSVPPSSTCFPSSSQETAERLAAVYARLQRLAGNVADADTIDVSFRLLVFAMERNSESGGDRDISDDDVRKRSMTKALRGAVPPRKRRRHSESSAEKARTTPSDPSFRLCQSTPLTWRVPVLPLLRGHTQVSTFLLPNEMHHTRALLARCGAARVWEKTLGTFARECTQTALSTGARRQDYVSGDRANGDRSKGDDTPLIVGDGGRDGKAEKAPARRQRGAANMGMGVAYMLYPAADANSSGNTSKESRRRSSANDNGSKACLGNLPPLVPVVVLDEAASTPLLTPASVSLARFRRALCRYGSGSDGAADARSSDEDDEWGSAEEDSTDLSESEAVACGSEHELLIGGSSLHDLSPVASLVSQLCATVLTARTHPTLWRDVCVSHEACLNRTAATPWASVLEPSEENIYWMRVFGLPYGPYLCSSALHSSSTLPTLSEDPRCSSRRGGNDGMHATSGDHERRKLYPNMGRILVPRSLYTSATLLALNTLLCGLVHGEDVGDTSSGYPHPHGQQRGTKADGPHRVRYRKALRSHRLAPAAHQALLQMQRARQECITLLQSTAPITTTLTTTSMTSCLPDTLSPTSRALFMKFARQGRDAQDSEWRRVLHAEHAVLTSARIAAERDRVLAVTPLAESDGPAAASRMSREYVGATTALDLKGAPHVHAGSELWRLLQYASDSAKASQPNTCEAKPSRMAEGAKEVSSTSTTSAPTAPPTRTLRLRR